MHSAQLKNVNLLSSSHKDLFESHFVEVLPSLRPLVGNLVKGSIVLVVEQELPILP